MPLNATLVEKRRRELNLSMAEAGRRAGFKSQPSFRWYQLETGRRSNVQADTLLAVARVLNLPPASLLTASPLPAEQTGTPVP